MNIENENLENEIIEDEILDDEESEEEITPQNAEQLKKKMENPFITQLKSYLETCIYNGDMSLQINYDPQGMELCYSWIEKKAMKNMFRNGRMGFAFLSDNETYRLAKEFFNDGIYQKEKKRIEEEKIKKEKEQEENRKRIEEDRKKREEEQKIKAQEEAERKAKEEAERKEKEEAERKAKEEEHERFLKNLSRDNKETYEIIERYRNATQQDLF